MSVRIAAREEIQRVLSLSSAIPLMREALIAQSRGDCDTPMPMHIQISDRAGEIHIKSSYRRGGKYFVVKVAAGFFGNAGRNLPTADGMMLLLSAETGAPVAVLCDGGDLTDARTAAVAAMVASQLGRTDKSIGILGSGVQAPWQARAHAEVLPLRTIWLWGRTPRRVEECRRNIANAVQDIEVRVAASPSEVARHTRLIVTTTAARAPLLNAQDIAPGTLISAVGSDTPGKQELHSEILEKASVVFVDSKIQCEKLGELQHAPGLRERVIEMGTFCATPTPIDPERIIVADFTGLGVEDLYIAEDCYRRLES